MKIELKNIKIREVVDGYVNNNEEGVLGYGGKLNIRPKYQREFIYRDAQRDEVINTIRGNFPLNVMYWVKNDDGTYEVLDGQQRTISFCSYVNGDYSIDFQYFHNLTEEEKEKILDYELMIYVCEGTDKEKLDWFKIINIAGEKLTDQELRNAIYTGEWLTDAKRYFSKTGCAAYNLAKDYMSGTPIRQAYLETVIKWIASKEGKQIEDYMSEKQHEKDAEELWTYFQSVINWIKLNFTEVRKEMKGIDWGILYNEYKDKEFKPSELKNKVKELMMDDDVTNKKGIYSYLVTNEEKHLNIRAFTQNMKREAYEEQNGICVKCEEHFEIEDMEGDHIIPWSKNGKTNAENCQMLCKRCNGVKSNN